MSTLGLAVVTSEGERDSTQSLRPTPYRSSTQSLRPIVAAPRVSQGSDDTTLKAAELGRKGGGADGGERHSRSGDPTGQVTQQARCPDRSGDPAGQVTMPTERTEPRWKQSEEEHRWGGWV